MTINKQHGGTMTYAEKLAQDFCNDNAKYHYEEHKIQEVLEKAMKAQREACADAFRQKLYEEHNDLTFHHNEYYAILNAKVKV